MVSVVTLAVVCVISVENEYMNLEHLAREMFPTANVSHSMERQKRKSWPTRSCGWKWSRTCGATLESVINQHILSPVNNITSI